LARLTRQQLKKDDFATGFAAISGFFLQNQKRIVQMAGGGLIVAAVAVAIFLYVSSRENSASGAFGAALTTFHAPVSQGEPQGPNAPAQRFKTDKEKYEQALKEFNDVSSSYSWFAQGKLAGYYSALCQRELGNLPEAEKELTPLAAEGNAELAAQAKMALAGLYQQTGRADQAEKLYRELESHPTDTVPKAIPQLALAEMFEKTKPAEATTLYQQIQKENSGKAAGDLASKALQGPGQ